MNAAAETECPTPFELRVGERLGRLEVLGHLADGGMARLWLAAERAGNGGTRGWYVVKTVLPTLDRASLGEYEEMLLAEAEVARRVRHPNVVRTFGVGRHEGHPYIVQELVPGPSLDRILRMLSSNGLRLPVGWVVQLGIGIARGLHGIHTTTGADGLCLGLIHRDINPSNVLLSSDGSPRIIDFGIAKPLRLRPASSVAFKGTMRFAPPEQIRGQKVDLRADLHALGILLHDALTGGRVFDDAPLIELAERRGSAPLLRDRLPEIPRELDRLLQDLTSADPACRPTNALEVAHQLERIAREVSLPSAALLGELARITRRDRPARALGRLGLSSTTDRRSGVRAVSGEDTREARRPRRPRRATDVFDQPTTPFAAPYAETIQASVAPEPTAAPVAIRRSFAPPRETTRPMPLEAQEPDTETDAWGAAPTASGQSWNIEALRAAAADPLSHVPTAVGPAPVPWVVEEDPPTTPPSHEREVDSDASAAPIEELPPSDDTTTESPFAPPREGEEVFDAIFDDETTEQAEPCTSESETAGIRDGDDPASPEHEEATATDAGQSERASRRDTPSAAETSRLRGETAPSVRPLVPIASQGVAETRSLEAVERGTQAPQRRSRGRRHAVHLPAPSLPSEVPARRVSRATLLGILAWLVATVLVGACWYFDVLDAAGWLVTGVVLVAWAIEVRGSAT